MDTEEKPRGDGGGDRTEAATSPGTDAWSPQKLEEAGGPSSGDSGRGSAPDLWGHQAPPGHTPLSSLTTQPVPIHRS